MHERTRRLRFPLPRRATTIALSTSALALSTIVVAAGPAGAGGSAPQQAAVAESPSRAGAQGALADVQPFLATKLTQLGGVRRVKVLVHGTSIGAARDAIDATGMVEIATFDQVAVAVAAGTRSQIENARSEPGITYLEGNRRLAYTLDTSHKATHGARAVENLRGANGERLDGSGVSVAVIDSGIDPTHPFFRRGNGGTIVVANLKSACVDESSTSTDCVERLPTNLDTDTTSAGGHGTHVNGIVAGRRVTLTDGTTMRGAAPGASLVSLSTGAGLVIIGADAALNWVLENHERPCGPDVSRRACPPIKVTNNSYGPIGGGEFDPRSATVKLQRALLNEGVVTVWSAGNDEGDGSESLTNPAGQDPRGGILSVASYFDENTGTRDGAISDYSSRGDRTDPTTWPDISAPGEDITSSCRPALPICSSGGDPRNGPEPTDIGTFNTISGTSMAAPHIAGIVAQLFQANPAATPYQVEQALKATAHRFQDGAAYRDIGRFRSSFDKGTGLVDVTAAARAIR